MEEPIIVVDREGEVNIFASLPDAASWIEPQDARDGEYRVFDTAGVEYLAGARSDNASVEFHPVGGGPDFDRVREIACDVLRSLPDGAPSVMPSTPAELRAALEPLIKYR
jgi:hypothetical protein